VKCSIRAITAGDAAYAAEVEMLQVAPAGKPPADGDPFLRVVPDAPREPSEVEMLLEGLREVERENE